MSRKTWPWILGLAPVVLAVVGAMTCLAIRSTLGTKERLCADRWADVEQAYRAWCEGDPAGAPLLEDLRTGRIPRDHHEAYARVRPGSGEEKARQALEVYTHFAANYNASVRRLARVPFCGSFRERP